MLGISSLLILLKEMPYPARHPRRRERRIIRGDFYISYVLENVASFAAFFDCIFPGKHCAAHGKRDPVSV
ncbi:MAG: hypothetical protein IKI50_04805, partial [Clostridia bacterium]|nr:hypothetical protein [Clostridia bacterium]